MTFRSRSADPKKVARFIVSTARVASEASKVRMMLQGLDSYIVNEWPWEVVAAMGGEAFAEECVALGQDDCDSRGAHAKYQLEHIRADGARGGGVCLAFVPARDDDEDETPRPAFDGTHTGLVTQLLATMKEQNRQIIDMSKGATAAQEAAMKLLGQSYAHIQMLMRANVEGHEERVAIAATVAESKAEPAQDLFRVAMETMGPELAKRLLSAVLEVPSGGGDH